MHAEICPSAVLIDPLPAPLFVTVSVYVLVKVAVTVVAAILVWHTRLHLLWMILAGAAVGMLGWV